MTEIVARVEALLEGSLLSRWAPLVVACVTAGLVAWMWGGLDLPGAVHDERSYLVQARLLASFTWTAPTPPVPAFWEMAHVFVEPALFSKYPPGHAPILVPGVWLGLEGLMPVVLSGASAAMIFVLARQIAGPWVGLLTWGIWTTAPRTLFWHATYFSQTTTSPLWLLAVLSLTQWIRSGRPWLLALVTACVAWIGITRPVTGVALGLPIAAVVAYTSWHRGSLAGWGRSAAIGLLICALIPLWGWRTLGSPTALPYVEYSKWYFPWDLPGFVRDTTPPIRELTPDLAALGAAVSRIYENHTISNVPSDFVSRLRLATSHPLGYAIPLALLAPVGAIAAGAAVSMFVGASFLLLIGSYLIMPQPDSWTIYYLEVFAIPPFLVALGCVRGVAWLRSWAPLGWRWRRLVPRPALLVPVILLVTVVGGHKTLRAYKGLHATRGDRQLASRDRIRALPDARVVVFVRGAGQLSPHFTLWDILGPPAKTDRWIVRDLGDRKNRELIAASDGRVPYVLDALSLTLTKISDVQ